MSVYGKCPKCGNNGVMRGRRPDGNDQCEDGHTYKSSDAIKDQERFELRTGRFGVYFYDAMTRHDMPLEHVLKLLNN